jgi:nitrate/TMAO reductase-like tetraheme cytochrome c subunit
MLLFSFSGYQTLSLSLSIQSWTLSFRSPCRPALSRFTDSIFVGKTNECKVSKLRQKEGGEKKQQTVTQTERERKKKIENKTCISCGQSGTGSAKARNGKADSKDDPDVTRDLRHGIL